MVNGIWQIKKTINYKPYTIHYKIVFTVYGIWLMVYGRLKKP